MRLGLLDYAIQFLDLFTLVIQSLDLFTLVIQSLDLFTLGEMLNNGIGQKRMNADHRAVLLKLRQAWLGAGDPKQPAQRSNIFTQKLVGLVLRAY